MNSKKTKGKKSPLNKMEPEPMKASPDAEMPEFMKAFEGKSLEQIVDLIALKPLAIERPESTVGALLSCVCGMGGPVPEWAKKAGEKSAEGLQTDSLRKMLEDPANADLSAKPVGIIIGLAELMLETPLPPGSQLEKIYKEVVAPAVEYLRTSASREEPEKAAAFFDGRKASGEIASKLKEPTIPIKIYRLLAFHWQKVESFHSTGELHKWLLSIRQPNGQPYITAVDSREVRRICSSIGLKFRNQWQK